MENNDKKRLTTTPKANALFIRIIYSSILLEEYNNHEYISDIINASQKNNSLRNIGGEIIWNSLKGSILQILEGPSVCVDYIFNKIKHDKRHKNISIVACVDITEEEKIYSIWYSSITTGIDVKYNPQISDFDLKSIIGSGGFSTVVKAYNFKQNKYFAIKVITKRKITQDLCNVIISEHEIWRDLISKNENNFINKLHWCFQDPLNVYFVMDLSVGGDMFDLIRKNNLKSADCLFYFCEVLSAIRYIHKNDIIYRDIKLENILINKDGHIVLTDFGVSEEVCKQQKRLCGTPMYFSPEMILHKLIDVKNDIWSLGIILYEMTGATVPWQGQPRTNMMKMILKTKLKLDLNWEHYHNDLIEKCMTYKIEDRPTSDQLVEYMLNDKIIENWENVENKTMKPPFIPEIGMKIKETENVILELKV